MTDRVVRETMADMQAASLRWLAGTVLLGALLACGEKFEGGEGGAAGAGAGGDDGWCGPAATRVGDLCVLAAAQDAPECPVIDETHVYWTTHSEIWRVDKDGRAAPELVSDAGSGDECLVLDPAEGRLWWGASNSNELCSIRTVKTEGLCLPAGAAAGPQHVAIDDTYVYWTAWDDTNAAGSVARRPKDGTGDVEVLASGRPKAGGLALDAGSLYWIDEEGLWRAAKGGMAELVVAPLGGDSGTDAQVTLDEDHVYWNFAEGLGRVRKNGQDPVALVDGYEYTAGIALVDGFVYFSDYLDLTGEVAGVAADGSARLTFAEEIDGPRGAAADAISVYWVTSPDVEDEEVGQVMKARIADGWWP